nr:methylated-DNA--[protein]-cysteine S-methyltransferase [uncultured Holophaga sp.]
MMLPMRVWHYELQSPYGPMWAALTEMGRLRQLAFGGLDPRATMPLPPRVHQETFKFLQRQLDSYFAGTLRTFTIPLEPAGTPFQVQVWEQLQTIPFGSTLTYQDLAERLGNPQAAQAVGAAVGANPIAILIPCHRVIGADGSLRGYAWGLEIKEALLIHEGALGGML